MVSLFVMSGPNQFVKKALGDFLKTHNIDDEVDEIVLEYVVGILADLGQSDCAEDLDIEEFVEMMEAYVPGFGKIGSIQVCEWMFELAANRPSEDIKDFERPDERLHVPGTCAQVSELEDLRAEETKQLHFLTSSHVTENGRTEKEDCTDPQVDLLLEMFPGSCSLEVKHCLVTAKGDMDGAVQLILHRQETGNALTQEAKQDAVQNSDISGLKDDKKLRDQMLARYGFVDETDDRITHKPVAPKQDKKKMVRYLDGRVVSTKGEKFTELKKEEDPEMKKTYVNLKPARKYRFH